MPKVAITGASGNVGRRVIELVSESISSEVTAVVRRSVDFSRSDVRSAIAIYEDRDALVTAFSNAETLVLITSDGDTASVHEHHLNIVSAAAIAGVANVVTLSGIDSDPASPFCYSKMHAALERLLSEQGFNVSVVRASMFSEFFLGLTTAAQLNGEIRLPASAGKLSLVGRDDVATALASLAIDPLPGIYNITGPQALDCVEIALLAHNKHGVSLRFTDITAQDHLIEMAQAGMDPWWMYAYSTMFQSIREQRWSHVSDHLLKLTGKPGKPCSSYL